MEKRARCGGNLGASHCPSKGKWCTVNEEVVKDLADEEERMKMLD